MKNKFLHSIIVIISFFTTLSFHSCSEDRYTIWTETTTYSDFRRDFQTSLDDGYYIRSEISNSQWEEQISKNLTREGRHKWDEATIKKWFISNGFGEREATKESSWFALIDHGFLASRHGNQVYMILK